MEARLSQEVTVCEQHGFMSIQRNTDTIFYLTMQKEKFGEGQNKLCCVIVDSERAYYRVASSVL